MNFNLQDIRGLRALLIGNKAERPGNHLQRTAAFSWDPDSTLGVGAWGGSSAKNQETKCEGKALEITMALRTVEQE